MRDGFVNVYHVFVLYIFFVFGLIHRVFKSIAKPGAQ